MAGGIAHRLSHDRSRDITCGHVTSRDMCADRLEVTWSTPRAVGLSLGETMGALIELPPPKGG